nr:hypothetical protein [Tanacetum cinerariifolium]
MSDSSGGSLSDLDDIDDLEMIMQEVRSEQEQKEAVEQEWRNYSKSWHGKFARGDKKYPTIMLKAVASYDLWIWHAFFGVAGANNDLTVLNNSPLFDDLLDDIALVASFDVTGLHSKKGEEDERELLEMRKVGVVLFDRGEGGEGGRPLLCLQDSRMSLWGVWILAYFTIRSLEKLFAKLIHGILTSLDSSPRTTTSDICQLIREECCVEVPEKQKQSIEDTMIELVKICQEKEVLCIHDDVNDLIDSALNFKLLLINSNSQRLEKELKVKNVVEQPAERENRNIPSLQNFRVVHKSSISSNTSQIFSIHAVAPILPTKEPEHLLSMGYEHLSITPEMESDKVTESNAENLLPIPSECKVALEDKRECDVPISENSPVCDNHSDIFSDSKIDDDILVYDDDFEDISQIQDIVLREKLLSITRLIYNIESLNDNSTPDRVLNSFESDKSLLDNFSPEFETFCHHSEETTNGNTTHADNSLPEYDSFCFEIEPDQERRKYLFFLEELLIDDSILSHESSDSNFEENLSIPRPPPEPPDIETDAGEEIPVMINDKDEDVDYSYSMFVIFDKMFSLLSAKSEDTIFDPGISD